MSARHKRGRESELRLAEYLQERGFPFAQATSNFQPGADITGTPGLSIEVKSRARLDLPAWVRQTEAQAGDALPLLVVRLNKQGTTRVGEWLAVTRLDHFLDSWNE